MGKILKLLLAIFLMFSVPCFTGCSDDEADFNEIEIADAPYNTKMFLETCFPGDIPESVIKSRTPDPDTGIQIVVTYPNGVKVEFDEEGVWQQVLSMDGLPLTIFPDNLISEYIRKVISTSYSEQEVVGLYKKDYGNDILLTDNQLLSFDGYRFLGILMTEDEYSKIPSKASQFILEHFPHMSWKMAMRTIEGGDYKPRYRIWMENNYFLEFDERGEWITIDGGKQLIPEIIVNGLPQGLLDDIAKLYPEAEITELYRRGEEYYEVRVSSTTSYIYNPKRNNIVWPTEQIYAFIHTYFGEVGDLSMRHPLSTEEILFIVEMPNGFSFTLDENADWVNVNGSGQPFPEKLYEILPSGIYEYIKNANPANEITNAERDSSFGYYIVLTNGEEYKFDMTGKLIES